MHTGQVQLDTISVNIVDEQLIGTGSQGGHGQSSTGTQRLLSSSNIYSNNSIITSFIAIVITMSSGQTQPGSHCSVHVKLSL